MLSSLLWSLTECCECLAYGFAVDHLKCEFLCPFLLPTPLISSTALFTAILKTSAWSNYQHSTVYLSRFMRGLLWVLRSSILLKSSWYLLVVLIVFFKIVLWFCCLQGYYFHANNPYKDCTNAFEQGLQKCKDGDLNSAVLLLEAAILQDPQDSEVMNPICNLTSPFIEHLCVF